MAARRQVLSYQGWRRTVKQLTLYNLVVVRDYYIRENLEGTLSNCTNSSITGGFEIGEEFYRF